MPRKIGVFGVGAIGSVVGGDLARAGEDITLIDPWFLHVETMKRQGLRITTPEREYRVEVKALHIDELNQLEEPLDILFVAVKSYDTRWVVRLMEPYLKPDGLVVSTQNSLNEEWIAPIIGAERTMGCVVTIGAGLYEPGHVTRTSSDERVAFTVGELDGRVTPRVEELARMMEPLGRTKVTTNIWGELWAKLATNSMANPICGLTGMSGREWLIDPTALRIGIRIGSEVVRVGEALGHTLGTVIGGVSPEDLKAAAEGRAPQVAELLAQEAERRTGAREGKPSLLQDVLKGRRTEIDYLDGLAARKGREVGVPAPACAAITALIKEVEIGQLQPDPSNLERLQDFL